MKEKHRRKLSAEEREKELAKQQKQQLSAKEQALLRKELLLLAGDTLTAKELPVGFKEFLAGADEKATTANIEAFETAWKEALEAVVTKRLAGNTPKAGEGAESVTKEQFAAMGYKERKALYQENPELYKLLTE